MIINGLKKYYLFVAAIAVSVTFAIYFFQVTSTDYISSVEKFKANFNSRETQLDDYLAIKANEIEDNKIHDQWTRPSDASNINIHVYRNDSLLFWNTNQLPIIRFAEIHFPADGLLNLQNGWYYSKTKVIGDYLVCASFLIKHDYAYENKHLSNNFAKELNLPFKATILEDKDQGFAIYSTKNEYICSLKPDLQQEVGRNEGIVLMVLLFVAVLLGLLILVQVTRFLPKKIGSLVPLGVLALRIASIHFEWFDFMIETVAFDPKLYAVNSLFPNFFEYLLNLLVLVYLLSYLGNQLLKLKRSGVSKRLVLIFAVLSILPWGGLIYLIEGLIDDSSIPMVIDQLFSLNVFSVLAMMSLGIFFYSYFQTLRAIIESCKYQGILGSHLAVLFFAVSCFYLFYETSFGHQSLAAGIFPFFFYGSGIYVIYRIKGIYRIGTGVSLLFGFSLVLSLTIGEFGRRKERGDMELCAKQLATEKNIETEKEYSKISTKLIEDKFLKRFIAAPSFKALSDFQENLERRFFNGFWEQYEMKFAIFDGNKSPIFDQKTNFAHGYDRYQEIIERSGVVSTINSSIYYIDDYREQYSYVIRQELQGADSSKAYLFCTLKSKKIPEEIGFPRLLISGKANVFESLETYSIAKYHNNDLVTKYGAFNYPSSFLKMEASGNSNSFNHGDFSHYAVSKSSGDKIVISRKDPNFLDYITSFSYLFSFYGLLLLPLLFRMGSSGSSRRTLNLAMKIQIVLISLVFISLLAFGWGSGIFVSNQYNQYTNDVIREKLSSVETEVRAKLGNYDQLFIDVNGSMAQYYLQKFARVFFTDINLYDANGYLLATSRPKVFNQGLISEQMNPEAFKNMKYAQKSEFVHRENIGNLVYSSAYKPFYNNNGKKLAFINLQHFGQQSEFENQIQKFLVAIVNVFILLLAVSIILAIFISNWLTAPLRILQESFSSVRFGIHNEPILYNKQDEIGALVKDYNSKLEELEFTAQQLARSERESAWREMAKQVAHEIKNPLTPMKLSVQQLLRTYNPKDTKIEEKFQRVAASIIEQIEALTNIANEFSSFAKMPVPMESRIELTALIKSVVEVFSLEGHSDIELFCDEKIFINADKDQMIRVFNNLIKNATQAIPQHQEGQISIQIQRIENKVKIAVSDNGIGIEKSKWNKLFVPYFTTKSTGTGLALAMVKQILESHQGVIDFETHPGEGTTFYVELPLADT